MTKQDVRDAIGALEATALWRYVPVKSVDVYVSPEAFDLIDDYRRWSLALYAPTYHADSWLSGLEMRAQVRL